MEERKIKNPHKLAEERKAVLDIVRTLCTWEDLATIDRMMNDMSDLTPEQDTAWQAIIKLKYLLRDGYTQNEGDLWNENEDVKRELRQMGYKNA